MRRFAAVGLLALLGLLAVPAGAADKPDKGYGSGTLSHGVYPKAGAPGARSYAVYTPRQLPENPPLFVYLHGCNQTADDVAVGEKLGLLADRKGFVVLYPEQLVAASASYPVSDGNGAHCWNWFLPDHQSRDKGEPATIAGMTRMVAARYGVDTKRVWVAGASAGADMTTILGATYPDLYAAIAPLAGCAYRTCTDLDGTAALAAMGSHKRVVPTFVVNASTDMVNNVAMGATAVQQWVATDDLADNGKADGSVPQQPSSTTQHAAVQGAPPGDPCLGNSRLPCAGGVLGLKSYPYTELRYDDARGRTVVLVWLMHGANHAFTGGDPRGTFVDPVGPDLGSAMYAFFAAHPMP
ncbi:MAG: poly(3-hydroxybutyrate) depolymerase [Frankiales bacterium]|nr:poly(3-hydroxybutyrate) depolymerase [Frankiales bacterium]